MLNKHLFTWPHANNSAAPLILAPPHLIDWASSISVFLKGKVHPDTVGFSTSGSSGGAPKAILFTREALEHCAQGALAHLHAETGDWCCPLPLWHVGGAMIFIRAHLAGTQVHTYRKRWNPFLYARFIKETQSAWSSLVPTQIVDLVREKIKAPEGIRGIIVGGGSLDQKTGEKARQLGWPIVQSYGMTEAGSQIATALPNEPFHTDFLSILPHWETKISDAGRLCLRGAGRFYGKVYASPSDGEFVLETLSPSEWWENQDMVELAGNRLTFLRRADRVVKILGELVDPDAIESYMTENYGSISIETRPHPRMGYELIACHADARLLEKACRAWNASVPGFEKIHFIAPIEIPHNAMGKVDRKTLQSLVEKSVIPLSQAE